MNPCKKCGSTDRTPRGICRPCKAKANAAAREKQTGGGSAVTARAKAAEVPTISGSPEIPGGPALTIEAGYGLILGSVQAKRWRGDRASLQDAYASDFVLQVVEPFAASTREEALRVVASLTGREGAP